MNGETEADYLRFVSGQPNAMLYHTLRYRGFLRRVLGPVEDDYLLTWEDGELRAVMPVFHRKGPFGAVVNSLPFFGSHGGVLVEESASPEVADAILQAFMTLCYDLQAVSWTVVEHVFKESGPNYSALGATHSDSRTGQVTHLPEQGGRSRVAIAEELMARFHSKTRNMVRKGQAMVGSMLHANSEETMRTLHRLHAENMEAIGGTPKSWSVFEGISKAFDYDSDYRVYVSTAENGDVSAALLVLFHSNWVEYFTPAIDHRYRSHQPLSALIMQAMTDAVEERGSRFWNWGGTWSSQAGVYRFKSRWGATDHPYAYHIGVGLSSEELEGTTKEVLLSDYPFFYVLPFGILEQSS